MTRTVQARQKGKCIFTTTCSFVREGSGGEKVLEHEWGMPEGAREELEALLAKTTLSSDRENPVMGIQASGPFMMESGGIINSMSASFSLLSQRNQHRILTLFNKSARTFSKSSL